MLRLFLVAFVVGSAAVHLLAALPPAPWLPALAAAAGLGALTLRSLRARGGRVGGAGRRRLLVGVTATALSAALGFGQSAWRAELRLADALDERHENLVTRVVIDVIGLPTGEPRAQRFEARVVDAPVDGIPERVMVGWYAPPHAEPSSPAAAAARFVRPGERYSAALVLRRPHGNWNPHGFDYEAWLFERGVRAVGTVRGQPVLLRDSPWHDPGVAVQRLRHQLREAMQPHLEGTRYGGVVMALALGDQAGVAAADWEVFNRTGITHLVSISGMHVTMLAGLAGGVAFWLGRRLHWRGAALAERVPAQVPAAAVALAVAFAYCMVAGWGVPAQRTFFMLATIASAAMLRLPLSPSRVLIVALALVTAIDPWTPLSPGFWLSFGAVGVLMLVGTGRWRAPGGPRWWRGLRDASALQLVISVALVPALALQFQSVSIASPLANALAIPVVSFVVTPLSLLAMVLAPLPGLSVAGGWVASMAEAVFGWMMQPIGWLATQPGAALWVAVPPWPLVALAVLGVAWSLQPRGVPGRRLAPWLVLPVVMHAPARVAPGEWRLTALDVGQGSAVVLETARHVLVFDTGPPYGPANDAGERVVWPYLRARGAARIDDLVISHADADHAGGLASLLARMPAERLRASYRPAGDADAAARRLPPAFAPCLAGQGWMLDGVAFRFLHPTAMVSKDAASPERNAQSCVLRVQGLHHAALLTGDVHRTQEDALVAAQPWAMQADVVLMAHHGSRTSSGARFVAASGASHAIAQAGYLSRYGHPTAEVIERWRARGAQVHRTDRHGAVTALSTSPRLTLQRQREVSGKYWHGR